MTEEEKRNIDREIASLSKYIYVVRDYKIMLDRDLAEIYGVTVSALNQAVRRNKARFPSDFQFKLTKTEFIGLRSQNVIVDKQDSLLRKDHMPIVFTEQGAFALSFVLKSPKAIEMGIFIVRAFTHLRRHMLRYESLLTALQRSDDLAMALKHFEINVEQKFVALFANNTKMTKEMEFFKNEIKRIKEKINLN